MPTDPPLVDHLLARPDDQRLREHKYRFGQTLVFGLPVLALQRWGHALGGGGDDAMPWVGLLQALLSGWVVYVGAAGMLVEGMMWATMPPGPTRAASRGRWVEGDLLAALAAIGLYGWSAAWLVAAAFGKPAHKPLPLLFHWVIVVLAGWTGLQWLRLVKRRRAARGGSPELDKLEPH